jgi:putative endonuclease
MALHIKTGAEGENLADEWLRKRGYEILHRNWRHLHYEIDIIAQKDKKLHFVEVNAATARVLATRKKVLQKENSKTFSTPLMNFYF